MTKNEKIALGVGGVAIAAFLVVRSRNGSSGSTTLQQQLSSAQAQIAALKSSNQQLSGTDSQLNQQVSSLQSQLTAQRSNNSYISSTINALNSRIITLQSQLTAAQNQDSSLQSQLAVYKNSSSSSTSSNANSTSPAPSNTYTSASTPLNFTGSQRPTNQDPGYIVDGTWYSNYYDIPNSERSSAVALRSTPYAQQYGI